MFSKHIETYRIPHFHFYFHRWVRYHCRDPSKYRLFSTMDIPITSLLALYSQRLTSTQDLDLYQIVQLRNTWWHSLHGNQVDDTPRPMTSYSIHCYGLCPKPRQYRLPNDRQRRNYFPQVEFSFLLKGKKSRSEMSEMKIKEKCQECITIFLLSFVSSNTREKQPILSFLFCAPSVI